MGTLPMNPQSGVESIDSSPITEDAVSMETPPEKREDAAKKRFKSRYRIQDLAERATRDHSEVFPLDRPGFLLGVEFFSFSFFCAVFSIRGRHRSG
ncbi:hypothetical protein AVEN_3263-1 [Araneus ventricosus]|uniref:Uncharacterized protein n=1 Tax=Araneus ventricosus TaxID=182803 RepID=A0A4Y2FKK7_ARAVE|nr:hypothetical protein AVEN_3263-1 [Araneus ventricosus]